jgi:hypothetical protein
VGDSVQWESQGALQFDKPRKITGFSEDRTYAFIEGSNAGIPVKQLQGVDGAPSPKPQVERVVIEPPKAGFRREVFALEGGEAILQWPAQLSAESFQDLQDWLKLILRKAERASKADLKD